MMDTSSFSIALDGKLAVGDGPELLVYRPDGDPLYKHFCDGILVGIAFLGELLAVVDSDGRVVFFRAADGLRQDEVQLDTKPIGAFASSDGVLGVVTRAGPMLVQQNGAFGGFPLQGMSAASFGPDASALGLGTDTGLFVAMDATNGAPWGTLQLDGEVHAVAWNHQGFWLVCAGTTLYRIDGGASAVIDQQPLEQPAHQIALMADGAVAALRFADGMVGILEQHAHRLCGHIKLRREVHGLQFGTHALLGIGLDDGDASTVDLVTRATLRTEPHPGRGRNNWNLDMDFDGGGVRAAITLLRSGGQGPELQLPPDEMQGGRSGCWGIGCMVFNLMLLACAGLLGIGFLLNYLRII